MKYIGTLVKESDGRSIYPRLQINNQEGQLLDTSFLFLLFGENTKVEVEIDFEEKIFSVKKVK